MKKFKFEISMVYIILGCKDIGIRKFEFVAKTQFLILVPYISGRFGKLEELNSQIKLISEQNNPKSDEKVKILLL